MKESTSSLDSPTIELPPDAPVYSKDIVIRLWSNYIDILRKNNKFITYVQAVTAKEYTRIYIQQGYAVMVLQGPLNTIELYVAATKQTSYEFIPFERTDLKYIFDQDGDYTLEEIAHKED